MGEKSLLQIIDNEISFLGKKNFPRLTGQIRNAHGLRLHSAHEGHQHHFLCRSCEGEFELAKCLEGIKTMTTRHFCVEDHEIILYGSCETC